MSQPHKMPSPQDNLQSIAGRLKLGNIGDVELLQAYAAILEELKERGVCRSNNSPVADYTEWLVCTKMGLVQERKSNAGFDAVAPDGARIEIKSRRVTRQNRSVQLSAIRDLEAKKFDQLVGVIYEADFTIRYAAMIPHDLVGPNARFSAHTNSHLLNLTEAVVGLSGVEDITAVLEH